MKKFSTYFLYSLGVLILFALIFNMGYLIFWPYLTSDFQKDFPDNTAIIQGKINSLPIFKPHHQIQFDFKTISPNIGVLACHWYGLYPQLTPGDLWVLKLKLKSWQTIQKLQNLKNKNLQNQDFNYASYLISHQYSGTCVVLNNFNNHKIYLKKLFYLADLADLTDLNFLRSHLRNMLWHQIYNLDGRATMMALVLGDRSGITQDQWSVLRNTGTNHLIAIAGLHIALVTLIGFFLAWNFFIRSKKICELGWIPNLSLIFSWLVGFIYSAMAGFSIPTQRALIMLTVFIFGKLLGLKFNSYFSWVLAAVLIILINPWSVLDAGMWLSFTAVFFLIYGYQEYALNQRDHFSKFKKIWHELFYPQWFIFIGLMPISLYCFGQFSTIGLITNFIAIPYLFFMILPLLLFSVFLTLILNFFSNSYFSNFSNFIILITHDLFLIINFLILCLWKFLGFFSDLPYSHILIRTPPLILVILSTLGAMILLTPRLGIKRLLGLILLLSVFLSDFL